MTKVGWNYGMKTKCPLCNEADDTQEHLLLCSQLNDNRSISPDRSTLVTKVEARLRQRETLITARSQDAT